MPIKEIITSEKKRPTSPNRGVAVPVEDVQDFIFVSATAGMDETGQLAPTLEEQAELAFKRVVMTLEAAGSSGDHVVQRRIFIVDIQQNISKVLGIERKYFKNPRATTSIGVAALGMPGMLIEVDVTAVRPRR